LYNLASTDLEEGDYRAAQEKFHAVMEISWAIGERIVHARTFFQLGSIVLMLGRAHLAVRLLAVCWLIDRTIGNVHAERVSRNLSALCSSLGYDQAQFDAVMAEVSAAYALDQGRGLIERAFAEAEPDGSG